jgi:hypothetical protein
MNFLKVLLVCIVTCVAGIAIGISTLAYVFHTNSLQAQVIISIPLLIVLAYIYNWATKRWLD